MLNDKNFKTDVTIEKDGQEIDVEIDFTHIPAEKETRWDDGAPAKIEINDIKKDGKSIVDDFKNSDVQKLENDMWDQI